MGTNVRKYNEWISRREIGKENPQAFQNSFNKHLFNSISCVKSWNPSRTVDNTHHGGIFNFDFSPDGSLLVAACERKSILMFDPFNSKLLSAKNNAHNDCVNCVRFLDSRIFATCSDDTTIILWDTRYMKHKIRTLKGHSNWVKNIEYASNKEVLVTSGFDGSIYMWDINIYSERSDCQFQRVFYTNGLMRTKLTPDSSKLIIATAGGYLMVIHDLDLENLHSDLNGFKPNMYRLMQMSQSPIRQGYQFNHVFSSHRNRVELISDFPAENEAEMIASLEVHPQGWCAVSRNTSSDEKSEWTCVHDIQSYGKEKDTLIIEEDEFEEQEVEYRSVPTHDQYSPSYSRLAFSDEESSPSFVFPAHVSGSTNLASSTPRASSTSEQERMSRSQTFPLAIDTSAQDCSVRGEVLNGPMSSQPSTSDLLSTYDSLTNSNVPTLTVSLSSPSVSPTRGLSPTNRLRESVTFIIRPSSPLANQLRLSADENKYLNASKPKIYENRPRLTHFIEEPNIGRGFIKEVCFSSDGCLVCSPFGYGVRVLSFDPACHELCDCIPEKPQKLYEVTCNMSHSSPVVTTKFSPTHCLLVSGCLDGKVDFHQPRL